MMPGSTGNATTTITITTMMPTAANYNANPLLLPPSLLLPVQENESDPWHCLLPTRAYRAGMTHSPSKPHQRSQTPPTTTTTAAIAVADTTA